MPAPTKPELTGLLRKMEPELDPREFVYCTVPAGTSPGLPFEPIGRFREAEGETLILVRSDAEKHRLAYTFPCRKITLRVHSSLEAVGFLAAIAAELAKHGISANCVSAYYHDHLFVPAVEGEHALSVLRELQNANRKLDVRQP